MDLLTFDHSFVKVNGITMHVAEKSPSVSGNGALDGVINRPPVILFLHGFPELWYTWRHQMVALSSLGYRTIAPDLRGYGDTDAPERVDAYTSLHVVGDLIGLIDAVVGDREKVFVVGHDWGAIIAWHLCLLRPDRVKALANLSVVFDPWNPKRKPISMFRSFYGDDYYICRLQECGEIEAEFAKLGTERALLEFLTYRSPGPILLPKGKRYDDHVSLPSWLTDCDVKYYVSKYEKNGFTGPVNYYRNMDRTWELMGSLSKAQVKVLVKFVIGDQDLTYHIPGTKKYIHDGRFKSHVPLLDEVVVIEGVGHFLHEERPDEISKHIHDYFGSF
ncbi:PREDICTED: bifunctional epoxide hydrolase 2 isoform X2 [Camelina sativa]|uniref:Bifunctional epoxide hydrolase 2 isoform X2 n=1 Tax=Camelina sativa TaxID=90675 RepID=A0ABM0UF33_CAMSA|nr:PREDICTED: bifunctional epoxide hydrolase 2 isoform X2 [Camelina sativa]